jgi:cytochrome c oxidase subunit I
MVTYDNTGPAPEAAAPGFFARTFFNSDHKVIGLRYLWLALGSVLIGMLLSLLMRIHVVWPGAHVLALSGFGSAPERYTALTILHGSLMVFLVLTTAPQAGFGNYFLPLQIGAREMAFPLLNLLSFWTTVASLAGITASFFIAPQSGISLWTASVALFCLAALLTSINFIVTTLDLRAKGMTLPRMPLTVWAWLINAILSMLIFSILLAACVFLLADIFLGSHFFSVLSFLSQQPSRFSQPTILSLWQRLFWFFAQAEVYVAMLPCFGIVSHLLSTFSRSRVWAERAAVLALCAVGVFGFCVWGEHMFSSGLNPWSPLVFSLLASSLGLPAAVLVLSWLGTLWNARAQLTTAMLFALGFVSLFLAGGVSGLFLARSELSAAAVGGDFVTGHFHLVMGVAATFAILGALFFWFPKMFGRRLNEPLGKLHFWLTFAGVYCVFMPMHWLGLMANARSVSGSPSAMLPAGSSLSAFVTATALLTVAAQIIFLFNFLWSLWRGERCEEWNPWRATTLEWAVPSPPPLENFGASDPVVYRGAYEFNAANAASDFAPQDLAPAPLQRVEQVSRAAQAGATER